MNYCAVQKIRTLLVLYKFFAFPTFPMRQEPTERLDAIYQVIDFFSTMSPSTDDKQKRKSRRLHGAKKRAGRAFKKWPKAKSKSHTEYLPLAGNDDCQNDELERDDVFLNINSFVSINKT